MTVCGQHITSGYLQTCGLLYVTLHDALVLKKTIDFIPPLLQCIDSRLESLTVATCSFSQMHDGSLSQTTTMLYPGLSEQNSIIYCCQLVYVLTFAMKAATTSSFTDTPPTHHICFYGTDPESAYLDLCQVEAVNRAWFDHAITLPLLGESSCQILCL